MTTSGGNPDDGTRPPPERVVVGVDGSRASRCALSWALRHAARGRVELHVVHAFDWLDQVHDEPAGFDPSYTRDDAARVLGEMVEVASTEGGVDPGDVDVTLHVVLDRPAAALVAAAADADLVVVGSRGVGGFRGLLLGSVSAHVVGHAPCPVLVHRTPAADADRADGPNGPVVAGPPALPADGGGRDARRPTPEGRP